MINNHRFHNVPVFLCLLTLALTATPASAAGADFESGWQLRFGAIGMNSGISFETVDADGVRTRSTNVSGGDGAGVSGEYRFTPLLGLELGLMVADNADVHFGFPFTTDALGFGSLTAGLNIHLTPDNKIDVYVGPLVAYVDYEDLRYRIEDPDVSRPFWAPVARAHITIDNTIAVGANLGFDTHFGGSQWSFCGALRYLYANPDGSTSLGGQAELDFDPLIVSLGAGYRF